MGGTTARRIISKIFLFFKTVDQSWEQAHQNNCDLHHQNKYANPYQKTKDLLDTDSQCKDRIKKLRFQVNYFMKNKKQNYLKV